MLGEDQWALFDSLQDNVLEVDLSDLDLEVKLPEVNSSWMADDSFPVLYESLSTQQSPQFSPSSVKSSEDLNCSNDSLPDSFIYPVEFSVTNNEATVIELVTLDEKVTSKEQQPQLTVPSSPPLQSAKKQVYDLSPVKTQTFRLLREVERDPGCLATLLHLPTSANVQHQITTNSTSQSELLEQKPIVPAPAIVAKKSPPTSSPLAQISEPITTTKPSSISTTAASPPTRKKPASKRRFLCPEAGCGKSYTTQNHLRIHQRSHTGFKPYVCTYGQGCTKAFATNYSLKAHSRVHTGDRPYKCSEEACGKGFKTSGDLQKHLRIHSGVRPFSCKDCGKSFTTSNILKVHTRTHTGERPYECEECGKAFASRTNLKNHVRIHSGERPYSCSYPECERRFTEYSSLFKHQLVHEKKVACGRCKKEFRGHAQMREHVKTAHPESESKETGRRGEICSPSSAKFPKISRDSPSPPTSRLQFSSQKKSAVSC